jgi:hypothetical protein
MKRKTIKLEVILYLNEEEKITDKQITDICENVGLALHNAVDHSERGLVGEGLVGEGLNGFTKAILRYLLNKYSLTLWKNS